MRRASLLLLALLSLGALLPAQVAADEGGKGPKVALIVGPVGEALTPTYIALADAAAAAAEAGGARVAKAYSPEATPDRVLEAVENASIVVYFGHGVGTPNPYGPGDPAVVNGWGLQGPNARGTHEDSWQDGTLAYYGEAWIAQHARPAPGWVMIYSNACYAPGASEGFDVPATPEQAQQRVSAYARAPLDELGASAYFATDFYAGAASIVSTILAHPDWTYGDIYRADPNYWAEGLAALPDAAVAGRQVWLQKSAYFEGKTEYWYAFSGDPALTPASLLSGMAASLDGYEFGAARLVSGAHAGVPVGVLAPVEARGPRRLPPLSIGATWQLVEAAALPTGVVELPALFSAEPAPDHSPSSLIGQLGSPRLSEAGLVSAVPGPDVPGTYGLQLQLLQDDGATVEGSAASYEVEVAAVVEAVYDVPASLQTDAGSTVEVPVSLRNTGAEPWGRDPSRPALVVVSWDRDGDHPDIVATARISVIPGDSAKLSFTVTSPERAGTYRLRVEVVTADYGSLLSNGTEPAVIPVEVTQPVGHAQRVDSLRER